jgi:cytochrome c oxidase subunit 4
MSNSEKRRSDAIVHPESEATTGLYLGVYGLLLLLFGLSVVLAYIDLGGFGLPVALGFSIAKTYLIILFFMHVYYSSRLTKLFSIASFGHLLLLFSLTMLDYVSRSQMLWTG